MFSLLLPLRSWTSLFDNTGLDLMMTALSLFLSFKEYENQSSYSLNSVARIIARFFSADFHVFIHFMIDIAIFTSRWDWSGCCSYYFRRYSEQPLQQYWLSPLDSVLILVAATPCSYYQNYLLLSGNRFSSSSQNFGYCCRAKALAKWLSIFSNHVPW